MRNKLFDHEQEENYYKPVRVDNFQSKNYTEYENNGDRNKTLSIKEYLNKIRPYLKDIINNLKISYICKNLINSSNYFFFLLETLYNDCECSIKYTSINDDLI